MAMQYFPIASPELGLWSHFGTCRASLTAPCSAGREALAILAKPSANDAPGLPGVGLVDDQPSSNRGWMLRRGVTRPSSAGRS